MITPLRGYVLIQPLDEQEKTASGLIVPDSAKDKPMKGKVISVGPSSFEFIDLINKYPGSITSRVIEGKIVYYKKWVNESIKTADGEFIFVKQEDLLGVEE